MTYNVFGGTLSLTQSVSHTGFLRLNFVVAVAELVVEFCTQTVLILLHFNIEIAVLWCCGYYRQIAGLG